MKFFRGVFSQCLENMSHAKGSLQDHFLSIFRLFQGDPSKYTEYFPQFPYFTECSEIVQCNPCPCASASQKVPS